MAEVCPIEADGGSAWKTRPPQWDGCPVPPDSARRVAMSFESVPLEMKINAQITGPWNGRTAIAFHSIGR